MRLKNYLYEALADMQTVLNDIIEKFELGPKSAVINGEQIEITDGPINQIKKFVTDKYQEYETSVSDQTLILKRTRDMGANDE